MRPHLMLCVSLFMTSGLIAQSGCPPHPYLDVFEGATSRSCETVDDMDYKVPVGPETGYQRISAWEQAEGNATRFFYTTSSEVPVTSIYQHYKAELQKAGFSILAEKLHPQRNVSKLVGGNTWLVTFYKANKFPSDPEVRIDQGSMSKGGTFYMAGHLESEFGDAHLVVAGKKLSETENVILVDVIQSGEAPSPQETEAGPVSSRGGATLVKTGTLEDPAAKTATLPLDQQILTYGKAVIHGITYNFNKHVIKDESAPILDKIGELLKADPSLNYYVVSHTSGSLSLEESLDLSFQRSESVVEYLVEYHDIDPDRLMAYGVGPMVPLNHPTSREGQEKNERVELVLRVD